MLKVEDRRKKPFMFYFVNGISRKTMMFPSNSSMFFWIFFL